MSRLNTTIEEIIFTRLLRPDSLLRKSGKTVIFATNTLYRLSIADYIIVLATNSTIAK